LTTFTLPGDFTVCNELLESDTEGPSRSCTWTILDTTRPSSVMSCLAVSISACIVGTLTVKTSEN
jgi:hypothetical protein